MAWIHCVALGLALVTIVVTTAGSEHRVLEAAIASLTDHSHGHGYDQDLVDLVGLKSISALPEHLDDLKATAKWLKRRLERAGLKARVIETAGPRPVVYAAWTGAPAGSPTVLIYAHYDVQPVDPLEEWHSPPFEVEQRGGYIYGRGVDDDKGGLLQALHAVEALLKAGRGSLPLNVKFLLEGEEEVLSPHLPAFLRTHKELLAADMVLSADGSQVSEQQGGILLGLRGILGMELSVATASTDAHSGKKGGTMANAAMELARLLAGLVDPATGAVAVEGFYEGVEPPDDQEREDAARFGWDPEAERRELGLRGDWPGERGYSALERKWHRPTMEVVGMSGGFTGQGIKTVIPHRASAKLSCRLVPGQHPQRVLELVRAHVARHTPSWASANLTVLGGSTLPWRGARGSPGSRAAAQVLATMFGKPPVYYRDGATIPALGEIQAELGTPATVFGWGLSENIHAPNERLSAAMWVRGREAWARLLWLLGNPGALADGPSRDEL